MTHKTIHAPREAAFGFLQTSTTTQRINLAVRRIKDATEETGIPKELGVEVRKFAKVGSNEKGEWVLTNHRKVKRLILNLDLPDIPMVSRIIASMGVNGASHIFKTTMEGKTSVELGVELTQLFNIMYSLTRIVNVHPSSDGQTEIPNLMEIYVKTEAGIWMSKLLLDGPNVPSQSIQEKQ